MNLLREMRKNRVYFVMLLPGVACLLLFNYAPMIGMTMAFQNFNYRDGILSSPFVGFDNFRFLFATKDALVITRNTLLYNLAFIVTTLVLSVFLAIAVSEIRNRRLARFYQSVMILPNFVSWVVASYLFFAFFSVDKGFVNHLLAAAGMKPVQQVLLVMTLLAILIGSGLTILLSNSISRPIKRLALAMKGVRSATSLEVELRHDSGDEVADLYRNFSGMMGRIQRLVEDVVESGRRERKAEMKALQAQINPHFLYNTLDSINWMALCSQEEEIASMVSSLAAMMRCTLRDADAAATIGEELTHVRNYLSIQATRYGGRFDHAVDADETALELPIPRFSVQPLVENALLHGTEKTDRHGFIRIRVRREDKLLRVSVSDNGAGADVNALNAYLAGRGAVPGHSDGIGILNVHRRIGLMFGDGFGLSYARNETDGVTATISMPAREAAMVTDGEPRCDTDQ